MDTQAKAASKREAHEGRKQAKELDADEWKQTNDGERKRRYMKIWEASQLM